MRKAIGPIAVIIQLGALVTVATLLPLFVGIWLDDRFHTAPWIALVGMVVGVIGAVAGVYSTISELYRRSS